MTSEQISDQRSQSKRPSLTAKSDATQKLATHSGLEQVAAGVVSVGSFLDPFSQIIAGIDRSGRMDAWRVSDPDGAAFRCNLLLQVLLAIAIATMWHVMTMLAEDPFAQIVLTRSAALPLLFVVAARIMLHELASPSDAPG